MKFSVLNKVVIIKSAEVQKRIIRNFGLYYGD